MCWLMKHTTDFCVCMRVASLGLLESLPVGSEEIKCDFSEGQ